LQSYPEQPTPDFGMYWLIQPTFDTNELARGIQQLYGYMSKFFRDEGQPYRVFIRKNFNRGGGGTALARSFTFGWNEASAPSLESLQSLLAHEMTHNWPALDGEHGDTAWYSEGAAEYYSVLLSHRAGVTTVAQFQEEVNQRATGYYTNPHRGLTNREAAKIFWSDWSAQRVPYGRGFMYLAQVDAQIRAKSRGKRSLDDVVVPLFESKKQGKTPSIDDWLRRVTVEIGPRAQRDYEAMVAGKTLIPVKNSFAPCFNVVKHQERPYVLGFDNASLGSEPRVVRGVVKGGAAELAGLRDGDEVLEFVDPLELQRESTKRMVMKVRRGSEQLSIEYLPRGKLAPAYKWDRVPNVPDSDCKL
jgi:predicted metalloprotease with PDZ domain